MKLLLILIFNILSFTNTTQSYDVSITIKNIDKVKGEMRFAIYNSKEHFLDESKTVQMASVEISGKEIKYTFKKLPMGEYAVSIFHDENSNHALDRNWIGLPAEGYCFSNNYKPFGSPDYEKAKFKLDRDLSMELVLNY